MEVEIERVEQRAIGRADCGVACVAMLAGCSYEQAFIAFGFAQHQRQFYTRHRHLMRALVLLGCTVQRKKFLTWYQIAGFAIVAVNHTKQGKYWHWVVWANQTILDPRPKRLREPHDVKGMRGKGCYVLLKQRSQGSFKSLSDFKDDQ